MQKKIHFLANISTVRFCLNFVGVCSSEIVLTVYNFFVEECHFFVSSLVNVPSLTDGCARTKVSVKRKEAAAAMKTFNSGIEYMKQQQQQHTHRSDRVLCVCLTGWLTDWMCVEVSFPLSHSVSLCLQCAVRNGYECMSTYGSIRISDRTVRISTAQHSTHTKQRRFCYMRKEHVENVPVYCSNMRNELTGKWHFASFSVVVFSFRSGRLVGRSVWGLCVSLAKWLISLCWKQTYIHRHTHANERKHG